MDGILGSVLWALLSVLPPFSDAGLPFVLQRGGPVRFYFYSLHQCAASCVGWTSQFSVEVQHCVLAVFDHRCGDVLGGICCLTYFQNIQKVSNLISLGNYALASLIVKNSLKKQQN